MRHASHLFALLLSLIAFLPAPAQATVAVHGMEQDPLGAATLSVTGTAASGLQLLIDNLGSSGQDGASITLPRSNGISIVYGQIPFDGLTRDKIIHRDLACRVISPMAGGGRVATFIEDLGLSGTGVDFSFDIPGSPELLVEMFLGNAKVFSGKKGYDVWRARALHLAGPTVTVDEPGVATTFRFGRPAVNTALNHAARVTVQRPVECDVTLEGVTYRADRIEVSFALSPQLGADLRAVAADLHVSCDGSGAAAAAGRLAIKTKGVPHHRVVNKPTRDGLVISANSGVTLENAGGATPDVQRIRVHPTSSDPVLDPPSVSLWGLPPGTPFIARMQEEMRVRLDVPSFEMPTGQSLTIKAQTAVVGGIAGGVVAGIVVAAKCTATGPNSFEWEASSDEATQGHHFELYRGPRQTVDLAGTFRPSSSHKPRQHVVRCESGICRMGFGFPPGATISAGGVTYDADSIVVVFGPTSQPSAGVIQEDWLPSLATRFTLLSAEGLAAYHRGFDSGNKVSICHRTSRFVPDGPGTVSLTDLGASGNDGMTVLTNGLPSVRLPFEGGYVMAQGTGLLFEADPCDDGTCASSSRLDIKQDDQVTFDVEFTSHGENPLFVGVGGEINPLYSLDSNGDGRAEIYPLPGSTVSISSVAFRQLSPYRECWILQFQSPVTILRSGQPVIIGAGQGITIWRNISGQQIGGPSPKPRAVSIDFLPPPAPSLHEIIGNKFEGVTLSGEGTDDQRVNNDIGGYPVIPTWATCEGPGEPFDNDADGDVVCELRHVYATDALGNPDPTPIRITSVRADDFANASIEGYVFAASVDSMPISPDGAVIEIAVGATVGGVSYAKSASLQIAASPGGSPSIAFTHAFSATSVVCEAYLGSTLVSSFPYTGQLTCERAPIVVALHAPPGDPGELLADCRFRSPGFLSNGGVIVVCDRLRIRAAVEVGHAEVVSSAVTIHGLPPGESLRNVRLAAIVPESVILATPGSGPGAIPTAFALSRAWPNPMRLASTVRFALPAKQHVRAVIMDVAGREVARLTDRDFEAGEHTLRWNGMGEGGAPVPAGLYFVRVESSGKSKVTRVTRLN